MSLHRALNNNHNFFFVEILYCLSVNESSKAYIYVGQINFYQPFENLVE